MKKSLLLLCMFLISSSIQLSYGRSPAVLPIVELEPENPIQTDLINAKGKTFLENKPSILEVKNGGKAMSGGLLFMLTLMLPAGIAFIILRKAHSLPDQSNLEAAPDNVIPFKSKHVEETKEAS